MVVIWPFKMPVNRMTDVISVLHETRPAYESLRWHSSKSTVSGLRNSIGQTVLGPGLIDVKFDSN